MIDCKLVNRSGLTDYGRWRAKGRPHKGDLIVKRPNPNEWGVVLEVVEVVHTEDGIELHVTYKCPERHP